jgi:hypothetical protein
MPANVTKDSDAADLSVHHLTPETFELVYNTIANLKFPTDVAQVLELRYLINHAVDMFPEAAPTPDYRDFRDALQNVIDATGIENKRHDDRLLRILTMLRELHYAYSVNTRNRENELRAEMAANRRRRRQSVRYSMIYTVAAILAVIAWFGVPQPGWTVQALSAGFAVGAWLHLHSLPALDRKLKALEKQMSELQRHRVKSIHWRMLVQKLALVLGFKRNSEVEVFRFDNEPDHPRSHIRH